MALMSTSVALESMAALKAAEMDPPMDATSPEWMPDDASTTCLLCERSFNGVTVRRHHCRVCGKLACGPCSRRRVTRAGGLARCCNGCAWRMGRCSMAPPPTGASSAGSRHEGSAGGGGGGARLRLATIDENQRWAGSWSGNNLLPLDP